jgi:hypothetical protein
VRISLECSAAVSSHLIIIEKSPEFIEMMHNSLILLSNSRGANSMALLVIFREVENRNEEQHGFIILSQYEMELSAAVY